MQPRRSKQNAESAALRWGAYLSVSDPEQSKLDNVMRSLYAVGGSLQYSVNEFFGVEEFEVVHFFAHARENYGDLQLAAE